MGSQGGKALAASGFDQRTHDQGVDKTTGLTGAYVLSQAFGIASRGHMVVANTALPHDLQYLFKMQQLFSGQLAQGVQQFRPIHITEHEIQGRTGRFLLTMGMINKKNVRMLQRPVDPG